MIRNTAVNSIPTFKLLLGLGLCTLGGAMLYSYFKQRNEDDDENSSKRTPQAKLFKKEKEVTVKFNVANEHIPLIVGRGGSNLSLIEEKTVTKIRFRDKDDQYKICEITGLPNDVKEAHALLTKEMERPPLVKEEIFVPQSVCGKITGRCGESLQEICRISLAKVSVDSTAGRSGGAMDKKRIVIAGNRHQVNIARKMIEDKIEEDEEIRRTVEDVEKNREPRRSPTNSISSSQTSLNSQLPPREKLMDAKNVEKPMEVYVSALVSPSKFWIQIVGPQSKKLDDLVQEMTKYYSLIENQKLHKVQEPYLGQIVAAVFKYDNKWYRAEIVGILPNKYCKSDLVLDLYFVDYGDSEYVKPDEVFDLRTDFLTLRFQAVEVFMANVKSTQLEKPDIWDTTAIEKFEELTQVAMWKKLIARVVTYKERSQSVATREGSPIPGVELYDMAEGSEISLGHMLISQGVALPTEENFGALLSPRNTNNSTDLSLHSFPSGTDSPNSTLSSNATFSPNVTSSSYEECENETEDTLIEQQLEHLKLPNKSSLNAETAKKLTSDFFNGNAAGGRDHDTPASSAGTIVINGTHNGMNGNSH